MEACVRDALDWINSIPLTYSVCKIRELEEIPTCSLSPHTLHIGQQKMLNAVTQCTLFLAERTATPALVDDILLAYEKEIAIISYYAWLFVMWTTSSHNENVIVDYKLLVICTFIDTTENRISTRKDIITRNAQNSIDNLPSLRTAVYLFNKGE